MDKIDKLVKRIYGKKADQARQQLYEEIEEVMPKEKFFGKDYDEGSNCDLNYVNAHNRCLSDSLQAIELLLGN